MADENANRILSRMLERLFAAIVNGPSLNCRPHNSRQRVDLAQLDRLRDVPPAQVLRELLGEARQTRIMGRAEAVALPPDTEPTDAQRAAMDAFNAQKSLLNKLRIVAEEAKTYEDDTGVYVLNVGFPLLCMPSGTMGLTRRVMAPMAFTPVALVVRAGASPAVELSCKADEVDRVKPNEALLAWLAQQTGGAEAELFEDEDGTQPWREIAEVASHVAGMLGMTPPDWLSGEQWGDALELVPAPRHDDLDARPSIVPAAVMGLFPLSNQGLLRDMKAMLNGETPTDGPVSSFINAGVSFDDAPTSDYEHDTASGQRRRRDVQGERFVALADPCQSRAVSMARESRGLVVHGPPGTGKSQTITNIIGDYLARGQRVLFVCDKRTALDVVANRLDYLGLGGLCALVHDPQRDQRDLYRAIRTSLEELNEVTTHPRAESRMTKVNDELALLHEELSDHWERLMVRPSEDAPSFHELMGQWLAIDVPDEGQPNTDAQTKATLDDLDAHVLDIDDIFRRADQASYTDNPWRTAAGVRLKDYLAQPMQQVREVLDECAAAARAADATRHESVPPFVVDVAIEDQAEARAQLVDDLLELRDQDVAQVAAHWAGADVDELRSAIRKLDDAALYVQQMRADPLDEELALIVRSDMPSLGAVARGIGALQTYLEWAGKWYRFVLFGRTAPAREALLPLGMTLTPANARRALAFLIGLRARLVLRSLRDTLLGIPEPTTGLVDDAQLNRFIATHGAALHLLKRLHEDAALDGLLPRIAHALQHADDRPTAVRALVDGLQRSQPRAEALSRLERTLTVAELFAVPWMKATRAALRRGAEAMGIVDPLLERADTIEHVLRITEGVGHLPDGLRIAVTRLLERGMTADVAADALRKTVLAGEIARRLADEPELHTIDAHRLGTIFDRYRDLEMQRMPLVRDAILHRWISLQKQRLLAGTGTRLNGAGADLRRRLTMRGRNAMRLRQVLAVGRGIEGGDPLMDMCPVWLASPETVAQIFPRREVFDVVIFDEASQCRLEEALPVLTRSPRVVIAGDPKQLPPTRFFESAVTASEVEQIETDQDLFEAQQGEVEDLLTAALSLDIHQCYLDVHYRSRNADLIAFSNEQFYSSRLQPIPGHPDRRVKLPPVALRRADGVYEDRQNVIEAQHVCELVRELLERPEPPSIGVACFNVTQRDLIADKLDELAVADPAFATRLAAARERRGEGSFDGLFVKNLENVQGDERDHIIISTTYGPDARGRFYRRFGPLGRVGGGRRLNVLITRARAQVHLVTSIPREAYTALPPTPPGQAPTGAWLLFAYLRFAEQLATAYEVADEQHRRADATDEPMLREYVTRSPSQFAAAVAKRLARAYHVGSDVHWGNDGFCIDIAMHHPARADDVTLGVLCDGARYTQAEDPVEWDVFRTSILESQGWRLRRLWSPHFFRDPQGSLAELIAAAQQAEQESPTT